MLRVNKLIQLEGPRRVSEFGESGDADEISPRLLTKYKSQQINPTRRAPKCWRIWRKWQFCTNFAKVVDEMLKAKKLTQQRDPEKLANLAKLAILTNFLSFFFVICLFVYFATNTLQCFKYLVYNDLTYKKKSYDTYKTLIGMTLKQKRM